MSLLENNKIRIRAVEPEDLDILYKWENNTDLWIHGNTLSPYSKLALRQYITETQTSDVYQAKQLRLMVELKETNETVGAVDLYDFDVRNKRAGIGVLIDEKHRNNNYAFESVELLKEYSFRFLRLHQLYAYIAVDNLFSVQLFEKCGFELAGTLKNWIYSDKAYQDVHIYQMITTYE